MSNDNTLYNSCFLSKAKWQSRGQHVAMLKSASDSDPTPHEHEQKRFPFEPVLLQKPTATTATTAAVEGHSLGSPTQIVARRRQRRRRTGNDHSQTKPKSIMNWSGLEYIGAPCMKLTLSTPVPWTVWDGTWVSVVHCNYFLMLLQVRCSSSTASSLNLFIRVRLHNCTGLLPRHCSSASS